LNETKTFILTNMNLNALSCEMTLPFEIMTPLGTPVVPLVKLNVYKSSLLDGFGNMKLNKEIKI